MQVSPRSRARSTPRRASTIGDIPPEIAEWLGSMINMDAPKHTKLRLIVNRGFTPRQVARIEETVRVAGARDRRPRRADGRVRLRQRDRGGAPAADHLRHDGHPARGHQAHLRAHEHHPRRRRSRVRADDRRADGRGHGAVPVRPRARARTGSTTRATTSPPRSCRPRSKTRTAGTGSRPSELGSFFLLLVVAGNETTRNAISHGMLRAHRPSRSARALDRRLRGGLPDRGRGDRALGDAGHPLPPHRDARRRRRRPGDQGRREGRDVLQLGQPRRARVRRPVPLRRARARRTSTSASAPAARTSASARTSPGARSRVMFEELFRRLPDIEITRRARHAAERLHPRHQAHALRLDAELGVVAAARS